MPLAKETGIKVLAFDQGGIYIGVDYEATVRSFERLGAINACELYTQANQTPIIDEFEQGKVSEKYFYGYLRETLKGLSSDVTDHQLYEAWNAMLIGVTPGVLEFIRALRTLGYVTIVVSNADSIHHRGVEEQLDEAGARDLFDRDAFDERFISYQIKFNKPYTAFFHEVMRRLNSGFEDKNILPNEVLFIDDSEKHIVGRDENEGAIRAGWHGLLVPSNSSVEILGEHLLTKLQQFAQSKNTSLR